MAAVLGLVLLVAGWTGTAVAAPPAAPSLAGPADGASVTLPFTISWSPVSGAGGYHWQLARSSDFTSVIEPNPVLLSGAATTDDVISGIPAGTYFWRVQAVSPDLEPSPWSAPRRVVVTGAGAGVPTAPTLEPPEVTQFRPLETITLSWDAVPGAVSYVLQESTDPDFPVGTRVRQVDLPGPSEGISLNSSNQGNFQARVLAVNEDGLISLPSNLVSFSVNEANPLPGAPTPIGPPNQTTTTLPLTLSWNHVPNHQQDGYQVQVSGSSTFSTVERTYRTGDNQLVVPTLTTGGKFWRVRSQHGYIGANEAYTAWSATRTFTVAAAPLRVGAVTFPPRKFSGGEARGSIDLTGAAPSGGATVTLSTDRPELLPELPESRVVSAGSTSVNVLVAPTGFPNSLRGMRVGFVTAPTPVTVTATYAGSSASTTITLLPPQLNDTPLQIFPVQATGGADMFGIVDLEVGCFAGFCDGLAPPGGFPITLSSSSSAASVPSTFTLTSGQGGNSFPISTTAVTRRTHVTISARAGSAVAHWTLTLTPSPEPANLTLVPATTADGAQGQATIPASEMAGYEQLVRITSSNPAVAAVPEFATVPASTTLARFDIDTSPVETSTPVTISVTGRGVTRSATLTVAPSLPALTALSVTPTSVAGGNPATGTVTLGGTAPSGGVAVSLGSNLPNAATVPPTVTVPAGATSATFPVTTFPVDNTTVQLSATLGSTTRFAALSVTRSTAATLTGVSLNPTTVVGGTSSTGTVTLSAAAPSGGTAVSLSDNSPAASVPSSVTVAAGATSRTFTVTTAAVSTQTPVTVTASAGGTSRSATLTVNPPTPAAPTLQSPANGATGVTQPVTLDWNDVTNATGYEVQVDDSSTISAPFVTNPTVTSSQSTLSGLPTRQLWWRVRARNAAGVFGPFSATRSFTPQGAATSLAAPTLQSPANDARFTAGQTIVFDWSDVSGAANYTIAIDNQDDFSSPTVLSTVTASTYSTNTLPTGRSWWRVRASDAAGNTGAWSSSRRLEVR